MYTKFTILIALMLMSLLCFAQEERVTVESIKPIIYLIPGQGADHRLFNNLSLDEEYEVRHIELVTPTKEMNMNHYAIELAKQIDKSKPFILIGTSLGGMLATEMSIFLTPELVILISSAKCNLELPKRYTFQKKFGIYKIIGPRLSKFGARMMQPIVEPDRRNEKEIFKAMLKAKDPVFMRRTIAMIINWPRVNAPNNIIQIHGDKDSTLPIKKVDYDFLIHGGSHMMTLTRGEELSFLIKRIIKSALYN